MFVRYASMYSPRHLEQMITSLDGKRAELHQFALRVEGVISQIERRNLVVRLPTLQAVPWHYTATLKPEELAPVYDHIQSLRNLVGFVNAQEDSITATRSAIKQALDKPTLVGTAIFATTTSITAAFLSYSLTKTVGLSVNLALAMGGLAFTCFEIETFLTKLKLYLDIERLLENPDTSMRTLEARLYRILNPTEAAITVAA